MVRFGSSQIMDIKEFVKEKWLVIVSISHTTTLTILSLPFLTILGKVRNTYFFAT